MGTGLGHYIPMLAYLAGVLACFASLRRPDLGLYFLIVVMPYRTLRDHFLDYPLGGNVVTLLVLCILIGAFIKGRRPPSCGLYTTWLIFGLYLYLSLWLGVALSNAPLPLWVNDLNFANWKDYMLLPLVFLAAGMVVQDRKTVRNVIICAAIAVALIDKSHLTSSLGHSWAHFDENKRDGGPLGFAGSNGLAAFLAQFSLFFWGFVQYIKRPRAKLVLYGLIALTLVGVMYAFSRAGYIAVIAGVVLLGILKDRKLIPIAIVFLCIWQAVVPTAVSERVNMTHNQSGQLEASAQERVDLWTNAEQVILANPIFGTGFATFQLSDHVDNLKDTHNWYVKVMIETGIIGLAFAAALLFQLFRLSWQVFRGARDPLYKGLGLGLLLLYSCSFILNCFGDRWTYLEINGLTWVLVGTAARVRILMATDSPEPSTDLPETALPQNMPAHLAYR